MKCVILLHAEIDEDTHILTPYIHLCNSMSPTSDITDITAPLEVCALPIWNSQFIYILQEMYSWVSLLEIVWNRFLCTQSSMSFCAGWYAILHRRTCHHTWNFMFFSGNSLKWILMHLKWHVSLHRMTCHLTWNFIFYWDCLKQIYMQEK